MARHASCAAPSARRRWQGPVLAHAPLAPAAAAHGEVAPAREAMHALLAGVPGHRAAHLRDAVAAAPGLSDLWELRSCLLRLLALRDGELAALRQIMRVDGCFPPGWVDVPISRPGSIG